MTPRKRVCPAGASAAIFVEGGDEERLASALLGVDGTTVFWMTFDGRDPARLRDRATGAMNDRGWSGIQHVGVVLDAEEDPGGSLLLAQSIFAALGRAAPSRHGVIDRDGTGRIGCYLLPDGSRRGALESLVRSAATEPIRSCVDALFLCTPNPGSTTARQDKAWVAAYAAACTGNSRMDQVFAPNAPAIDVAHPAFEPLRFFLRELVG